MKLLIISSHPIQYNAPLFRRMTELSKGVLQLKVLYTKIPSEFAYDEGFQRTVEWDVPLLIGYDFEFVSIEGSNGIMTFIESFDPEAVLFYGYRSRGYLFSIFRLKFKPIRLFFRGTANLLLPEGGLKMLMRRWFFRILFNLFDGIFHQGVLNWEYFRLGNVPVKKLHYAPHSVNNEQLLANADRVMGVDFDDDEKVFRVLFAAKFQPLKRAIVLLRAFEQLRSRYSGKCSIECVFVGSGHCFEEVKLAASNIQNVKFLGFKNQSEMPSVYSSSNILVLPSQSETWGLVVNEAMLFGLPCIVSDRVGCHADLIIEGVTGSVFEVDNEADLARKLNFWLLQFEKGKIQSDLISNRIRNEWNMDVTAEAMLRKIIVE